MNRTIRTLITIAVVAGFRFTAFQFANAENKKIDRVVNAYETGNYSLALGYENSDIVREEIEYLKNTVSN